MPTERAISSIGASCIPRSSNKRPGCRDEVALADLSKGG